MKGSSGVTPKRSASPAAAHLDPQNQQLRRTANTRHRPGCSARYSRRPDNSDAHITGTHEHSRSGTGSRRRIASRSISTDRSQSEGRATVAGVALRYQARSSSRRAMTLTLSWPGKVRRQVLAHTKSWVSAAGCPQSINRRVVWRCLSWSRRGCGIVGGPFRGCGAGLGAGWVRRTAWGRSM